MIIAFNGCAASGKGTLAAITAKKLGLCHYDFGLIYRAAALFLTEETDSLPIELSSELIYRDKRIYFRGGDVTELLRSERAGLQAAKLASYDSGGIASFAKSFITCSDFVVDGRTVSAIFPDADIHFQVIVDLEIAYTRREAVGTKESFRERWQLDESRNCISPRAITVDTSRSTIEQSVEEILGHLARNGMWFDDNVFCARS